MEMKTFNTIQQYAKSQNNLALIKGTGEVIYQIPKNAQFLTGNKYVHYNRKLYGPIKYYGEINDGLMFMGDGTTQKANIFEYTYTDGKDSHTVAIVTDNFMEAKIDISPATPAEVKMSPI
jgi:hypothetical protein